MNRPAHRISPIIWTPEKGAVSEERDIANECAFAFEYNCLSHAVMMVTPADLEDYIYGFSLTEGIIQSPSDILAIKINETPKGLVGNIEITPHAFENLSKLGRVLTGRTGCGICGADRLEHAIRPLPKVVSDINITAEIIYKSMIKLRKEQKLNHLTGAMHAAAFVNEAGEIILVREDVGRHNALDKLIGHMIRQDTNPASGFALITSRCSFEMIHKCASAGIPIVAAVSAPTGLAIELADKTGVSLAAFVRKNGLNIYSDTQKNVELTNA
jgi:FdhD protein